MSRSVAAIKTKNDNNKNDAIFVHNMKFNQAIYYMANWFSFVLSSSNQSNWRTARKENTKRINWKIMRNVWKYLWNLFLNFFSFDKYDNMTIALRFGTASASRRLDTLCIWIRSNFVGIFRQLDGCDISENTSGLLQPRYSMDSKHQILILFHFSMVPFKFLFFIGTSTSTSFILNVEIAVDMYQDFVLRSVATRKLWNNKRAPN